MTPKGSRAPVAERLALFAETRDPALRAELIEEHLELVERLAHRFMSRGEPLDDLVQAGSIGLIKAVDRFDPTLGYEFNAYATTTILGELKRHFRDRGWSIRASRRVQELYLELAPTVEVSDATTRSLADDPRGRARDRHQRRRCLGGDGGRLRLSLPLP